jgi:hypothetical protein
LLRCCCLDATAGNVKVAFVNLDTDETPPRLKARHARCAAPHERVEDECVITGHRQDRTTHQPYGLFRWVSANGTAE